MAEEDSSRWRCNICDNVGLSLAEDGFYYCNRCGSQAEDVMDTGVADEDFVDKDGHGAIYTASLRRTVRRSHLAQLTPSLTLTQTQSQFWSQLTEPQTAAATATIKDNNNDHIAFIDSNYITQNIVKKEEGYIDGEGPTEPEDFGSGGGGLGYEEYYNEVRMRYVMGVQLMVEFQCEALVEKFNVHPAICGFVGPIWMRFLALTGVFGEGWADETIQDSELLVPGDPKDFKPRTKYRAEPHNIHGQRAVIIWFRALRKRIPLSCSLAISLLACHVAREAVLPTDIEQWSVEGKLPYVAAYLEIEKCFGQASNACPISASAMFRPSHVIPIQKLEALAASIAQSIGLHLPPVNFYAIASRYLKQLSLPVEKILPHACRIHEWSMPPDLWLSTNEFRLPTRVCVMSILIVSIRILCNINGFGIWESSFSNQYSTLMSHHEERLSHPPSLMNDAEESSGSPSHSVDDSGTKVGRNWSHDKNFELDAAEILKTLEAKYSQICDTSEYSKDLPTYLQYCKDVAFAGLKPPFEDFEEERLIEQFWNFYQKEKDSEPLEDLEEQSWGEFDQKRQRINDGSPSKESKRVRDDPCVSGLSPENETFNEDTCPQQSSDGEHSSPSRESQSPEPSDEASADNPKDKAIKRMKSDMEENRFCYIPPRVKLKKLEYLHYARKKDEGALTYAAHADYYILLRACARVAQVDIRIMHVGVLSFEKRLAWTEKRIDRCLHLTAPNITCEFCSDVPETTAGDDPIGLSNLSF